MTPSMASLLVEVHFDLDYRFRIVRRLMLESVEPIINSRPGASEVRSLDQTKSGNVPLCLTPPCFTGRGETPGPFQGEAP